MIFRLYLKQVRYAYEKHTVLSIMIFLKFCSRFGNYGVYFYFANHSSINVPFRFFLMSLFKQFNFFDDSILNHTIHALEELYDIFTLKFLLTYTQNNSVQLNQNDNFFLILLKIQSLCKNAFDC